MSSHINSMQKSENDYSLKSMTEEIEQLILKPYLCEFNNCGKRFAMANELIAHINSHNN